MKKLIHESKRSCIAIDIHYMLDIHVNFDKERARQDLRFADNMLYCLKGLTP